MHNLLSFSSLFFIRKISFHNKIFLDIARILKYKNILCSVKAIKCFEIAITVVDWVMEGEGRRRSEEEGTAIFQVEAKLNFSAQAWWWLLSFCTFLVENFHLTFIRIIIRVTQ